MAHRTMSACGGVGLGKFEREADVGRRVNVGNGGRDVGACFHGGTGWKNKKAQAREHLGQSRLRLENCYLREVSSRDANRPRLVIILRDSVCLIAMEDFMMPRNVP